jgi:DNA-binding MarR family transcriptional regulator
VFADRLHALMPRLCRAMMRYERNYLTSGVLTLPQLWALEIIREVGAATMHDLAAALQFKSSSATMLVDRLEHLGLIRRQREARDRRVVRVALSARGRRALEQIADQKKLGIRHAFKPLSARERGLYLQLIEKMAGALSPVEAAPGRGGRS